MFTNRCNTMEPKDDLNLREFLERFKKWGKYGLIYAAPDAEGQTMKPVLASEILMSKITVRDAWQVGFGDPDCAAIRPDDDPIIPPNCPDAPVLKLLEELKAHQNNSK